MQTLLGWVRTLTAAALLASLLELLIPPGSLARFARLAMGLVLAALLLSPLSRLSAGEEEVAAYLSAVWPEAAPAADYAAAGTALRERWQEEAWARENGVTER